MAADLVIDSAGPADLPGIIGVLAEDELGAKGDLWNEDTAPAYQQAFARILADPGAFMLVARKDEHILGFLHGYFVQTLSARGKCKAVFEAVFVAAAARGQGVGARLLAAAEDIAARFGAQEITLTSNKIRLDAHRFYRNLGYELRHEGFRKVLQKGPR